ncbi:AT-rich interactive domain-containing protein 2 isoform X4 [Macrosteles quadrilineatus]|uniref:AT-rich interactive domain-containing protein 2 isoform X4 n=1 Tax=Macrosteles quadrilineatus TaxID=74068 RepID=UPI0023E2EFAA|nr:AT-rich interactive domain-containing protein 2 isoform X4 [Macrosteles quadrilineatus]
MAKILNKDPALYQKERDTFIKELQHFHETRGTPSRKTPKINGQEIDLFLLYNLVTTRGGWLKVNSRNEWDAVLDNFNVPKNCVNSSVALKQIYLRYLDRYEKVHYLGEVGERANDDDEDNRHRRWSARALHSVPLTYNYSQHNVNENTRSYNCLSTELYKASEYDRLALSLTSPLPNEQDFAINVCTLLSNEGKHQLRVDKHPRLVTYLCAHAAVYNHGSTRELFLESYSRVRGHSTTHFWPDVLANLDLRPLMDESRFVRQPASGESSEESETPAGEMEVAGDGGVVECGSGERAGLKLEPEDLELFCLGRTLGTQDYYGQRVLQVAHILRNLTFVEDNIPVLAQHSTFLRFVLLCCGAHWNNLQQMGFDMLTNIASEVVLREPYMNYIFNVLNKGLESQDRFVVLSCIETLNKLGQNEKNEEVLLKCLEDKVYERICSFLSLHDIMLLVHTLECLYSLSSLGERSCNSIVRVHGALDTLVSLITVEAQSYGPKACILMRVVETVSGGPVGPQTVTAPAQLVPVPPTPLAHSHSTLALPLPPTPAVARPVSTTVTPVVATTPHRVMVAQQPTAQVAQENEQFALAWLRATLEPSGGAKLEQGELYKQYINSCAKIGRRGVIAPLHFPRCVRSVFGGSVGPKPGPAGDSLQYYEGIQVRGRPAPTPTPPPPPASPILKAQLSAPTPNKKETKPSEATSHPHLSQALLDSGGGEGTGGPSSLIKSLLANKVNQRQQQQRLLQAAAGQVTTTTVVTTVVSTATPTTTNATTVNKIIKLQPPVRPNGIRNSFQAIEITIDGKVVSDNSESNDSTSTGPPPPPLAPLSGANLRKPNNNVKMELDDSNSTGNNSITSFKDTCSATGGEEGENSLTSFEGILFNGVPNSLDVDDTTSKDSTPKSLMLADLLEKNVKAEKEPPMLNGALRLGEKGLELIPEKEKSLKRPSSQENGCDTEAKRPHINGDAFPEEKKEEEEGEVKASSTAANLYASLAAECVDDDGDEVVEETTPTQPLIVTAAPAPRQILVTAVNRMGQHYVVAQPQTALVQGQTQTVLVAQTAQQQGTGAKTIIILQPQSVSSTNSAPPPPTPTPPPIPPPAPQKVIVQRLQSPPPAPTPTPPLNTNPTPPPSPKPASATPTPVRSDTQQGHFLCEWRGCMRNFKSANEVYMHACEAHCPSGSVEIQCLWERCDAMKRKRFSLMTHLYDRHCNADVLRMMAVRRKQLSVSGRSEIPPPTPPTPHPGYAPNAAFHAIKRHALEFVNPKEMQSRAAKPGPCPSPVPTEQDDNEGPVTKSIRLTSALILRNLVIYSTNGRRYLTSYEPHGQVKRSATSSIVSNRDISLLTELLLFRYLKSYYPHLAS